MVSPFIELNVRDWKIDGCLSQCSPSTRGIWIDLICHMHQLNTGGQVTATLAQMARVARCLPDEMMLAIRELQQTDTATISSFGDLYTVTCRRIQREFESDRKIKMLRGDWSKLRDRILKRDCRICGYCGGRATAVDHIIPRSRGGSNEVSNLISACKSCNSTKNDKTPEEAGMVIRFRSGRLLKEMRTESKGVNPAPDNASALL